MSETVQIGQCSIAVHYYDTIVAGSGAAGFAASYELIEAGKQSFCMVTEGIAMGTSRNTGSDKQTYYKLSLAGSEMDSVRKMAADLYADGCVNGDTALYQAALSAKAFYRLVSLGVPFPCGEYGEYVGYRTDHDRTQRAVTAGPLTSRYMVEALEKYALGKGLTVYGNHLITDILQQDGTVMGLIALDKSKLNDINNAFCFFLCGSLILATGGPAGLYRDSVYPASQNGATGAAFRAGAQGANLTDWQYGIASKGFRWNLSGSYQQVLPRYYSVGPDGSEHEFLSESMSDSELLAMTFLKGYEWPFDAKKAADGSSRIDLAVYRETKAGRRVYLDFTRNPCADRFGPSLMSCECADYLNRRGAFAPTPAERLEKLNRKALVHFQNNGIDLKRQPVEICVAAQHNNGGLCVDAHCRTNITGLYAIGEAAATFGIYRPGGTALNATQTDAMRAVADIATLGAAPPEYDGELRRITGDYLNSYLSFLGDSDEAAAFRERIAGRMSDNAAFVRERGKLAGAFYDCLEDTRRLDGLNRVSRPEYLPEALINRDLLTAQSVYIGAMLDYCDAGGCSRGSFLVMADDGDIKNGETFSSCIQTALLTEQGLRFAMAPVRPLPETEETVEELLNAAQIGL